MKEIEIKGSYLRYILSRFADPIEDIPKDPAMSYEDFKASILKNDVQCGIVSQRMCKDESSRLPSAGADFEHKQCDDE